MMRKATGIMVVLVLITILLVAASVEGASYNVQRGDSLWKISQRYNVTVSQLKSANGLSGDMIFPGQTLAIPQGGTSSSQYTVQRGDTLWKIAQKYNTTVAQIKSINSLTTDMIIPGQILTISAGTASRGSTSRYSTSDVELLARLVRAEAGGESYTGQVAVAATVLNRVNSSQYPNTIPGVVYQRASGYIQYCPVRNGTINRPATNTARSAVVDAINGRDPSRGALSFYNPRTATNAWIRTRPVTTVIGNHVFVR
ncbi:MAG: LysM peptidoglycan-binding domain-containing protein [Candidatus Syntrophonatronum acetioxidans]|uniref:LysM peptidoglycan-binding domain-containing protein n=1 Tax=Candidatus Syntrophonatronum acetioxidans TaxID=1795816 RepID=A0A424YC77_9FIRM|nr:MAG: LysM peptidoglycan-binding domain-containing protein [Candidatus Syntrophonatronum acetioxidans]